MKDYKKEIAKIISKVIKIDESIIEVPPDPVMGDYALPCFSLAKQLKKSPADIAADLAKQIQAKGPIQKVEAKGPYVNFFVEKEDVAEDVLTTISKQGKGYGKSKPTGKTILVESPGPNTNKPLHLGHVRNMLIGQSLYNILKFAGNNVFLVDVVNDRGVHICKSMLAYKKWGRNKKPDKKPDHFVGDMYVLYSKKETEEMKKEVQEMLVKWEERDKETIDLWKKMRGWCLEGFKETYKRFDFKHDKQYFESDTYKKGKEIVAEGIKKGTFHKDEDGSVYVDLEKYGLGKKILQRSDGTAVYITQDLYMASARYSDYKMDKMIYVVASEQIHHFKVLFRIFEILKRPFTNGCYHLAYGMVYLPEGKMKSREGKVIDADNLIEEMTNIAEKEVLKRHKELNPKQSKKRAEAIGMAALRFFFLKYDPMKDFVYNPRESISFEGETGPYVQYAHTRICSILRRYKEEIKKPGLALLKNEKEAELIRLLADFPSIIQESAEKYKPHLIARYLLELSQKFNEYYHECNILKEEEHLKNARILLVKAIKQVLENGLGLLGMAAPEEM